MGYWKLTMERYDKDEKVALKKFGNFVDFNNILNEMAIHLKTHTKVALIKFYGIMQKIKIFKNINWL
ncbi:hypothetical protein Glove_421g131 [Diversispora epigaea]|uniref:Uncharacterized protein n=1 Tax=Diversispora epigaea TaxID=1348612 RepID=A0A397H0S8_9GLOM|nr:hypothetical protein Glove_421g131 [Diversispora epigaea]